MKPIKFTDIQIDIQNALQEKLKLAPIKNKAGFTLIEGFMMLPLQGQISNTEILNGTSIPTIGIVGNSSGRIYNFALKAILPTIKI